MNEMLIILINVDLKYYIWNIEWGFEKEITFFFFVKCYLIFLYYFGHIEDVFLFLIYFSGGLFDMIIIDFH